MMQRVAIVGTGLIGASIGLALRAAGFQGTLTGIDTSPREAAAAVRLRAVDVALSDPEASLAACRSADVIVLAVPVLAVMDWMGRLAPLLRAHQLVTDAGSTKLAIATLGTRLFSRPDGAHFLPGHPMAGKEAGGALLAESALFAGAMWLFTPTGPAPGQAPELALEWRAWVTRFGARTMDLDPERHDRLCAWVSHLPQMVATAMSALFEDEFAREPEMAEAFQVIGGRALREMTRLGASPYSMWRDIAMTNTAPLAGTLFALEQRLAHMRENLKTPELREEFKKANEFRARHK